MILAKRSKKKRWKPSAMGTIQKGDSILVESGRLHAIDAGSLILEIQQNSDTTYRVYDWGRLGLDGQPRSLHIEESMQCIDFNDFEPKPMTTMNEKGMEVISDSDHFRIKKFNLTKNNTVKLKDSNSGPIMIHVLEGKLSVHGVKMQKGNMPSALFPAIVSFLLWRIQAFW